MNCKYCGAELSVIERRHGGHRPREYCNDAHRQAFYRRQHQQDQAQGHTFTEMLFELVELRRLVSDQAQTIKDLEQELAQMRSRLDVERRYLEDTTAQRFKAWLRKQPSSPWHVTFLNDQTIKPLASRSYYEAHVRRLHCSEEEHQDFVRLWKLMLLSQA